MLKVRCHKGLWISLRVALPWERNGVRPVQFTRLSLFPPKGVALLFWSVEVMRRPRMSYTRAGLQNEVLSTDGSMESHP